MKNFVLISLLLVWTTSSLAADAARVAGDLKVDGLYFTNDPNKTVITKPSDFPFPWTVSALNIYYLDGNVAIGTIPSSSSSAKLEVLGNVNATSFSGDGTALSNVTASSVADGSITSTKINGTISPDKLDLTTVQKKYGKVAVVAKSGGDYSDPEVAMNDINTWCNNRSAVNPCLMKIMPGVYDLRSGTLVMQPYVDIEGSGENTTVIASSVPNVSNPPTIGTVNGSNSAEIRFLTISNFGVNNTAVGMVNSGASASPKITNVTIIVNASAGGGMNYGLYNDSGSPNMNNVTVNLSGGPFDDNVGVYNSSSSATMINVTANATGGGSNYGVYNMASWTTMTNVSTKASLGDSSTGVMNVSSNTIMSNVIAVAENGKGNSGVYNFNCSPNMYNVVAGAWGGTSSNYGVNNYTAFPIMNNVIINVMNGGGNYGVYNSASSSPVMSNVSINASGGVNSCGIFNDSSSPSMSNVTVTAIGGSGSNIGLSNHAISSAYSINIDRSTFTGATNSILNDSHYTLLVGATKLTGATNSVGTYSCVGAYSGGSIYTALNTTCK